MAGSRRRFRYESDSLQAYSLVLDESNGEATISGGARLTPNLVGGELNKPSGFTPRYILAYLQSNPLIRRKFIIGSTDSIDLAIAAGATISAGVYANADGSPPTPAVWVVTAYRGEKLAVSGGSAAPDTGLTDGDNPG